MANNRVTIEFDTKLTVKHISNNLEKSSKIINDLLSCGDIANGEIRINDILIKIQKVYGGK